MPFRIKEKIHAKNVAVVSKEKGVWKSIIHGDKLIAWGEGFALGDWGRKRLC